MTNTIKPQPGRVYLLRERFDLCPDGYCQTGKLTEDEKRLVKDDGALFLTGVIQRADAENGNTRIYPYKILKREMDNYMRVIKENRAYGEIDHPDIPEVNMKNASHRVVDLWWEGKDVWGKLRINTHTPAGQIAQGLIKDGGALGISSRGLGSVHEDPSGRLIVEDDFQIICFDLVSEPSTHGAFLNLTEVKDVKKQIQKLMENKIITRADKLHRALSDFFITNE